MRLSLHNIVNSIFCAGMPANAESGRGLRLQETHLHPVRMCTHVVQIAPWWRGGSLFSVLDDVEPLPRDPLGPFRMSVIDKYKDMGTIAMGKSEAGIVRKGDRLYVMPNKRVPSVV